MTLTSNGRQLLRRPHLELWMWCIAVTFVISLPYSLASCQGIDIAVSIEPQGTVFIQYGKPLELYCIGDKIAAENLQFQLASTPVSSEIVNSTTRRMYIERLEQGVYVFYCRNLESNRICTSRVIVGTSPNAVTDFGCVSKNIDELKCTWNLTEIFLVTNYSLSFSISGNFIDPCIATIHNKKGYCSWDTTSPPRYKQMENRYYFRLKSCNYFGCIIQNFTIDHFAIVKPDPPINLKIIKSDPHIILLRWSIPGNMVDILPSPVVHRIQYQIAGIDDIDSFRTVDASNLPPKNKTYTFLLSDLPYAHRQYNVRIQIKTALAVEDKFWSDFTEAVFTSASEKPQRPPHTTAGAFSQVLHEDKRDIYVYWQQLEGVEETGANATYKILATQGSNVPQILYPDKNQSLSYAVLNDASLEAIDISIWSLNAEGSSDNSSHLYIPSKEETEALKVHSFSKLSYDNGTYQLSWESIENVDNYSLFWCRYEASNICIDRINYAILDPKKNYHVIHLPTGRYQFAIAANSGAKSGGMTWASWVALQCS